MASDYRVVANDRTGADGRFIADPDVFAENRVGADGYVLPNLGGCGNDGGGINFAIAIGIAEQLCGSGKGEAWLGGNQDGFGGGAGEVSGDYGGGGGAERGVEMPGVLHED